MKSWIKTSIVAALTASALLSGSAAMAARGDGSGPGWRNANPEQMKEKMTQQTEVKLARLELALALTLEQKPAWADFKKAVEARTGAMLENMESMRKAGVPKTALERLDRMEEMQKQHSRALTDMRKAVETFYGKLNAAQKTVFDDETARLMCHSMRAGRGMGMGMGPGMNGGNCPGKGGKMMY
jgi:hypothetical protein